MADLLETGEQLLENNLLSGNNSVDVFGDESKEDKELFGGDNDREWLENDEMGHTKASSCKRILYETIGEHTRVWDVLILLPNIAFLAFLLFRFRKARRRLSETNAPIMSAFYTLVLVSTSVSVFRSAIAIMSCNVNGHAAFNGRAADKVLWVVLRAFLLATEISVLAFALLTAHLDSKASIRRVVLVASSASFLYSAVQMGLEFGHPDTAFKVTGDQVLFGHGGRTFWALSSAFFALVYAAVLVLPLLPCRHSVMMPQKRSFYYYVTFLMVLNVVQAVGAGMAESSSHAVNNPGLCFVNMTTYVYFVAFTPIVYFAFLAQFFGSHFAQPTMLFAYKAQNDEMEDFTLQQPGVTGTMEEDDIFSQDQNNPIIIHGGGFGSSANSNGSAANSDAKSNGI